MRGQPPTTTPFVKRGRSEDADYQDQMFGQGSNPPPARSPLSARSASPSNYNTSGMEAALGAQADKIHKPRRP